MTVWVFREESQGITEDVEVYSTERAAKRRFAEFLTGLRTEGIRIRWQKTRPADVPDGWRPVDWEATNDYEHWAQVFECEIRDRTPAGNA